MKSPEKIIITKKVLNNFFVNTLKKYLVYYLQSYQLSDSGGSGCKCTRLTGHILEALLPQAELKE